jgi:hypothetical protein
VTVQLDIFAACATRTVADRRRLPDGAGRLLAELCRRGLADGALERAAALVLVLELEAAINGRTNGQTERSKND